MGIPSVIEVVLDGDLERSDVLTGRSPPMGALEFRGG